MRASNIAGSGVTSDKTRSDGTIILTGVPVPAESVAVDEVGRLCVAFIHFFLRGISIAHPHVQLFTRRLALALALVLAACMGEQSQRFCSAYRPTHYLLVPVPTTSPSHLGAPRRPCVWSHHSDRLPPEEKSGVACAVLSRRACEGGWCCRWLFRAVASSRLL